MRNGKLTRQLHSQRLLPAEKLLGLAFLLGYLCFIQINVKISFPSSTEALLVLICAWLNLVSHLAVVSQLLDDGLLWNIFLGVGFDVASAALYYARCTRSTSGVFWIWCLCVDGWLHTRALFLWTSLDRLTAVVRSATHNLQGNPGWYWTDHIFAYTDTGKHLVYWAAAAHACGWQTSLLTLTLVSGGLAGTIYYLSQKNRTSQTTAKSISSSVYGSNTTTLGKTATLSAVLSSNGRLVPRCDYTVCQNRTSFSVTPAFCRQWHCTFQQILVQIERIHKTSSYQGQQPAHSTCTTR